MLYSTSYDFLIAQRESISFQIKSLISIKIQVIFNKTNKRSSLDSAPPQIHSLCQFPHLPEAAPRASALSRLMCHLWRYLAGPNFSNKSSALFVDFYFFTIKINLFCISSHRTSNFSFQGLVVLFGLMHDISQVNLNLNKDLLEAPLHLT